MGPLINKLMQFRGIELKEIDKGYILINSVWKILECPLYEI